MTGEYQDEAAGFWQDRQDNGADEPHQPFIVHSQQLPLEPPPPYPGRQNRDERLQQSVENISYHSIQVMEEEEEHNDELVDQPINLMGYQEQAPKIYDTQGSVKQSYVRGPGGSYDAVNNIDTEEPTMVLSNDLELHQLSGSNSSNQSQDKSKWQDKAWIGVFIVVMLVFLGLTITGFTLFNDPEFYNEYCGDEYECNNSPFHFFSTALTTKHIVYTLASVLSSVGIAAAFIIVWSIFSRIFPKGTVYIAVGFIVILPVLTALIAVIEMRVLDSMLWEIIAATTSLGGAIITVILIFTWRKRVKQTVATMEAISLFFDEYYVGSFVILILSIVLVLFWGIVWGFAVLLTQPFVLLNPVFSVFAWIFYVIVWLWTTQVIRGMVHTTMAGIVSSWCESGDVTSATKKTLKRVFSKSIGSIMLGGALTPPIQSALQFSCCADSCHSSTGAGLLRFSKYCYTEIAMEGDSFTRAGNSVALLLVESGADVFASDSLIGNILFLVAVSTGLLSTLVSILFSLMWNSEYFYLGLFICFLTAYSLAATAFETMDAVQCAFFVCVAKRPSLLKKFPRLYEELEKRYAESSLLKSKMFHGGE